MTDQFTVQLYAPSGGSVYHTIIASDYGTASIWANDHVESLNAQSSGGWSLGVIDASVTVHRNEKPTSAPSPPPGFRPKRNCPKCKHGISWDLRYYPGRAAREARHPNTGEKKTVGVPTPEGMDHICKTCGYTERRPIE